MDQNVQTESSSTSVLTESVQQPVSKTTTSQHVQFTSNPFLSFGKGLGAGLHKSAGAIMGLSALIFLATIGVSIGGFIISAIGFIISPIIGVISILATFVAFYIVLSLLMGRGAITLIKSQRGESVTVKETAVLVPFNFSLKLAGYLAIYGIVASIGLMFFIIPGLIIIARWSLGLFVMVDEKVGPIDAIKKSWTLTSGNTWNMLGATITSNIVLGQAFLLTMGTLGATANRYHELKALSVAGIKNTTTHWLNYVMAIVVPLLIIAYMSIYIFMVVLAFIQQNTVDNKSNTNQDYSDIQQDLLNGSQDSLIQYCFYNGEYSDTNAQYVCMQTKEECKANQYCSETYMLTDEQYN